MSMLAAALAGWTVLLILGVVAAAAALASRARDPRAPVVDAPPLPITLIKPIRGLDDALERSFAAVFEADPERSLQVIVAIESPADPAWPVVERLARAHPDRDVLLLATGPSKGRMGKIHNMIEAMARAKNERVVFSDADCCPTRALLAETRRAFADGCEAVFSLPYHPPAPGLGGVLFQIAFNQSFAPGVALAAALGHMRFCAGAWMGYTRSALERAGGLEQFAHAIADDIAISGRVTAVGAKTRVLRERIVVEESGTGLRETAAHLSKWSTIMRACLPGPYLALPLLSPGLCAAALWTLCELAAGPWIPVARGLFWAAIGARAGTSFAIDYLGSPRLMPLPAYLALGLVDFGTFAFWLSGFRSTIDWRGTRYRLAWGGRAEVVEKL